MRAEVKAIHANDIATWPVWEAVHPSNELQWFTVQIGPVGTSSADLFQVVVATPQGLKERRRDTPFVGIVVSTFVPAVIEQAICDTVAKVEADAWQDIVAQLQLTMRWEYTAT